MLSLLRLIAGRCPTHGRASALVIAELEAELGIDPDALTKLRQHSGFVEAYADPRIIDCGRFKCRR